MPKQGTQNILLNNLESKQSGAINWGYLDHPGYLDW